MGLPALLKKPDLAGEQRQVREGQVAGRPFTTERNKEICPESIGSFLDLGGDNPMGFSQLGFT